MLIGEDRCRPSHRPSLSTDSGPLASGSGCPRPRAHVRALSVCVAPTGSAIGSCAITSRSSRAAIGHYPVASDADLLDLPSSICLGTSGRGSSYSPSIRSCTKRVRHLHTVVAQRCSRLAL